MDVDEETRRLNSLIKDPQANKGEIVGIYYSIAKNEGSTALISLLPILNKLAVRLLSSEVITILKNRGLEAFSYVLVANNLLEVEDIKDELENEGDLMKSIPSSAIRKLKVELGIAPAVATLTSTLASAAPTPLSKPQAPMGNTLSLNKGTSPTDQIRLATEIKNQCINMKIVKGVTFYNLPLTRTTFPGASSIVRRFSFGKPDPVEKKMCKTILLMGATGSGKTTMINAMINYVLGVQWEDSFRFILIDEDDETSQAFSKTREVTAYDIHYRNGFLVPYSLTIVDTPGFGDTEGIQRDQEITSAIKQFFEHKNGIHELNAVGFVMQSSLARLTSSQKYIFNSVLSIFGKDIEENVRFLLTFADGWEPLVLAAIKEAKLRCRMDSEKKPCHQSFNNRVIYASNQTPGRLSRPIEWDNAIKNFRLFFDELCIMPVKSLQLTKEVLKVRETLHVTIESLQTTIKAHLMKMEELRMIKEIIALNEDLVDANENFEFKIKIAKKKLQAVAENQTALNCSKCEVTCHFPCNPNMWTGFCPAFWRSETLVCDPAHNAAVSSGNSYFFDTFNRALVETTVNTVASLLSSGRTCKVCPGKCKTDDHVNQGTKWTYVLEEESRTFYDLRKKYDDATERMQTSEGLKNALQEEVERLKSEIIMKIEKANHCSTLLNEKALQGDSLSTPEYINVMIENQKKEKKPGYCDRIRNLEDLLIKAKLMKDVLTDDSDLVNQFKKK